MIPEDPAMLASMINMKLRDFYDSLSELCEEEGIEQEELEEKMRAAGFSYDEEHRRFL